MAIEVFNRHENKYLLDEAARCRVEAGLAEHMELDAYNQSCPVYTITNLYYDTDDNYLIRTSLQKPRYKEKLRLRAYGLPSIDGKVYVEIKKKLSGVVNKRRSAMLLGDACDFLASGILPAPQAMHNRQVLHEIAYLLQQRPLKPALYMAYDRRAYFGCEDHDLRISFDCNIRSRRHDLRLESSDFGQQLLPVGTWLMEIKVSQNLPMWLSRLLADNQVFPTSFSKYGFEYQQRLAGSLAGGQAPVRLMPSVLARMPAGAVYQQI